jgi:WW domain-binding protein 2
MDYGLYDQHASIINAQAARVEESSLVDLNRSWLMLKASGDIQPLPHESILYKTRGRLALELSAPSPGAGVHPFMLKSDQGVGYITNQRVSQYGIL